MCGEDSMYGALHAAAAGSPPACAGKAPLTSTIAGSAGDHPRVRGDDVDGDEGALLTVGTTPACAGKTGCAAPSAGPCRDHPRVRGEDTTSSETTFELTGPPPRARGRRGNVVLGDHDHGTTPACAGKTAWRSGPRRWWRDHPRVRGEDVIGAFAGSCSAGPPPRARGRHLLACGVVDQFADFCSVWLAREFRDLLGRCMGLPSGWRPSTTVRYGP